MSHYGWDDCPEVVKTQVRTVTHQLVTMLAPSIVGVYLHGSLAMNCFNPHHSDLDLLAVTNDHLSHDTKRHLAQLMLDISGAPRPIELSIIAHTDLVPWQHPTPFDFHYSETWREYMRHNLINGGVWHWNNNVLTDPDLAAHITITRQRGVRLYGKPIAQVFPDVPQEDYRASILADVIGALDTIQDDPVYAILNTCRVYAFLQNGLICSKHEGGHWALMVVPVELRPVIMLALERYATTSKEGQFDPKAVAAFASYMRQQLRTYTRSSECAEASAT
jgi:hypothetical protein